MPCDVCKTGYVPDSTSHEQVVAGSISHVYEQRLISLVPVNLRPHPRENDHVFVEASQVEGEALTLRVWGYGNYDVAGFRWRCQYGLLEGAISCAALTSG